MLQSPISKASIWLVPLVFKIHHKAALKAVGTQSRAAGEVDGISDAQNVEVLAASPGIAISWPSRTSGKPFSQSNRSRDLSVFPPIFAETHSSCSLVICLSCSTVCIAAPCSWAAASTSPTAGTGAPSL